ncbi:MAG TPA: hypothetical protein DDZ88_13190 [Verrucomicrobiales bacterium]|nr:hypothetical protein [Verrucomicrobiales bacterium]
MNKLTLQLCLIAASLAFHPNAHADTMISQTTICPMPTFPPICPEPPMPHRPIRPLPMPINPWDQFAVNGTDGGCIKVPGKPTRPFPTTTSTTHAI